MNSETQDRWAAAAAKLTELTRADALRWQSAEGGESHAAEYGDHDLRLVPCGTGLDRLTVTCRENGAAFLWPASREVAALTAAVCDQAWRLSGIEEWLDALEREATK